MTVASSDSSDSSETLAHNGLPGPHPGTPARRPGSVRRTTSLDLTRPHGPDGPLHVGGRARDLHTDADGTPRVIGSALASLTVEDGIVTALSTYPRRPALAQLIGRRALVGWRTGLWRTIREDVVSGSDLHQLLDDLPGGFVISGFTRGRALALASGGDPLPQPGRRLDVCAGWASDSRAARILDETGSAPRAVTPPAPPLLDDADPHGWHTWPATPIWGISRRRRIDAWVDSHSGDPHSGDPQRPIHVDAMFRDSFVDHEGVERVLHEYTLHAQVGRTAYPVLDVTTAGRVLPHHECPVAAASAQQILGMPCDDLRDRVSTALYGPESCTHLNDGLRSLTDVPAMLMAAGLLEP
ncbi:MAG: DUF2889 domain-containing protein [Actinomycetales bacterium]|nr:DUF2889 domain-containing protein [Actinomycetales bacterium]